MLTGPPLRSRREGKGMKNISSEINTCLAVALVFFFFYSVIVLPSCLLYANFLHTVNIFFVSYPSDILHISAQYLANDYYITFI